MPNTKEIPYVFRTLFGAPLDIRSVVSSMSNLLTELPLALRYEGLIIYITDQHAPYIFVNGITDSNCVPLASLQTTNAQVMRISRTAKKVYEDKIYIDNDYFRYTHDKGLPTEVILSDFVTGEQINAMISNYENEVVIKSKLRGFFTLTLVL